MGFLIHGRHARSLGQICPGFGQMLVRCWQDVDKILIRFWHNFENFNDYFRMTVFGQVFGVRSEDRGVCSGPGFLALDRRTVGGIGGGGGLGGRCGEEKYSFTVLLRRRNAVLHYFFYPNTSEN